MPDSTRRITRRQAVGALAVGAAGLLVWPRLHRLSGGEHARAGEREAERAAGELDALLDDLASRSGVRSAILAAARGDGSFRWIGAAGAADPAGAPMTAGTPYHVASIDKLFTAAAVLRLHEQGVLDVEERIAAYLPPALLEGLHRWEGVDRTPEITVRHLLTHTSGLADCFEDRPKGGRSLMERLFHEGDMGWSLDDLARLVRSDLRQHFPPQPAAAVRPRVRYSDTNFQLLIAILETTTDQPLEQVYDELLIGPLDLRHTWLYGRSAPRETTAEPSVVWFEDRPLDLPRALRSFPSLYSTADDQLRFLHALVGGEVFESAATLELMQQRWNRFGFPRDAAALRAPSWPAEYAVGIMRFQLPRLLTPRQRMPAVIGHTGSTGSWLFYCAELDLLLCGTVNQASAGAVPYRVTPTLLRMFGGAPRNSRV